MEIRTLKDLKKALSDIPDDVLEEFGANFHEDVNVQLLCWKEEGEAYEFWSKSAEKYPEIRDINDWIENISKATISAKEKDNYEDFDDLISSKDKFK